MPSSEKEDLLRLIGAKLIFRNFAGQVSQYNQEGKRSFCVIIDEALAKKLLADKWNVRKSEPRVEGDEPTYYLQVAVSYANRPPSIMLVTKNNKTFLKEEDLPALDWAEIQNVDLVVRPYHWTVNGNSGVKPYLKTMYVTIEEDELSEKYAHIPTAGEVPPPADDTAVAELQDLE